MATKVFTIFFLSFVLQDATSLSERSTPTVGRAYFQNVANREEYVESLRRIVMNSDNANAEVSLAQCELIILLEPPGTACPKIEAVMKLWPDSSAISNLCVRARARNRDIDGAKSLCLENARKFPGDTDTAISRALLLREVTPDILRLSEIDPAALLSLAQIYSTNRQHREALTCANAFLTKFKKPLPLMEETTFYIQGMSLFSLGEDYTSAAIALEKAFSLSPERKHLEIATIIARCYLYEKNYEASLKWAEKANAIDPNGFDNNALIAISITSQCESLIDNMKMRERAITSLKRALKRQPNDTQLSYLLAINLYRTNHIQEAVDLFRPIHDKFGLKGKVSFARFIVAAEKLSVADIRFVERTINEAIEKMSELEYEDQGLLFECMMLRGDSKQVRLLLNGAKKPESPKNIAYRKELFDALDKLDKKIPVND